jgi:lysophospholipase L1-like esterase
VTPTEGQTAVWPSLPALVLLLLSTALPAAGCGGAKRSAEPRQKILVAALGDSITAGSPGYDPDPRQRKLLGFGSDPHSQWEYWAQRKDPRLDVRNCGVYGERTGQIARRLDACARGAAVLVIQAGIDDIVQGRPVGEAAGNLRRMVLRGRRLGLRVELAELTPWNNGYPAADPKIRRLNALIRGLGRRERVRVLPFYETLEDPAHPGRMKEQWTADGDHPSVAGYRLLGEQAFKLP